VGRVRSCIVACVVIIALCASRSSAQTTAVRTNGEWCWSGAAEWTLNGKRRERTNASNRGPSPELTAMRLAHLHYNKLSCKQ
jgi:hypothetical protein